MITPAGDAARETGDDIIRYLEENVAAAEIALSQNDLVEIDGALPAGAASGERYAPEAMRALNG